MNTFPDANQPSLDRHTLGLAMDLISDELEKLHCLAIALKNQLEPEDRKNPDDGDNLVAWRLAEVLSERAGDVSFLKELRGLLCLDVTGQAT